MDAILFQWIYRYFENDQSLVFQGLSAKVDINIIQLWKGQPLNISGLNSPSSIIDNLQKRQLRVKPTITPLGISLAQPANTEDKVSISNEGQKKLSAELGSAMDKNVVISGVRSNFLPQYPDMPIMNADNTDVIWMSRYHMILSLPIFSVLISINRWG